MSLIQGNASKVNTTALYTKTIDQSLRFEDGDTAYLTLASGDKGTPTNVDKCTISVWLKRGNLSSLQTFMFAGTTTNNTILQFDASDQIFFSQEAGGAKRGRVSTSAVFRDPSAWYHIVFAYDSTESTAADRAKLWVNGVSVEFTNQTDAIDSGRDNFWFSNTYDSHIGYDINATTHRFDGYMAEYHGIDGQALDHTSFGELKSGIWIPKEYSGTYGTNGFYLDFADSAAIGDDESGNTNDWTVTNLVASDVVPDSPTNNFATLNSVEFLNNSGFLSEGNLKISDTSSSGLSVSGGTIGMKSGKWYWEAHLIVQENGFNIGVVKDTESATSGTWNYTKTNFYAISGIGTSYVSDGAGSRNAAGTTFAQGDTVQVAYDADTGKLYFGKNGTWLNSADPAAGTGNLETTSDPEYGYHPATSTVGDSSGYSDVIMNFGQDSTFAGSVTAGGNSDGNGIGDFKYTVPSGFLALCTSNLPNPAIDPAQDVTPEDHFNAVLYTGNGTAIASGGNAITGVGFQPDWVWIKERSGAADHGLYDSIRGTTKQIETSSLTNETTESEGLTNFGTDGFTVGSLAQLNTSSDSYVAWCWKAGTAVSGTTSGSGTLKSYSGSTNTDLGFSIITYEGNGTAGHEIPHHLGAAPDLVIVKNRTDTIQWGIYHSSNDRDGDGLPETDYLQLPGVAAIADDDRFWDDTPPDATVMTLGSLGWVNDNTDDHVMYCFRSVDQVSKCGYYIGNASDDGPFVFCGFRPKFLILVKSQSGSGDQWSMWDSVRSTSNEMSAELHTESTDDESTIRGVDFLSNGFKIREGTYTGNINTNNHRYVFYAVAEQPFKYSNAR